MLRLCLRIILRLLVWVGLEGGQEGSREIGYGSNPDKGDLWRRADPCRGGEHAPCSLEGAAALGQEGTLLGAGVGLP